MSNETNDIEVLKVERSMLGRRWWIVWYLKNGDKDWVRVQADHELAAAARVLGVWEIKHKFERFQLGDDK